MKHFYIYTLVTLVVFTITTDTIAAPVPIKKPAPSRKPVVVVVTPIVTAGKWVLVWDGIKAPMTLTSDGLYSCLYGGVLYTGSWTITGNTFNVTESTNPADPRSWHFWSVNLCKDRNGIVSDCQDYIGSTVCITKAE